MAFDMSGMRIIVAGGSRGIGRSIALAFAAHGAGVSVCARKAEALEATRDELARATSLAHAAACDLSQPAAVRRYVEEAATALN
ncbi:MAG TPA: 3-oxoacyl-ACP reductase, partial [Gammaproteobacteria bacterium]|nr:3-oxoacyl-ACP reductase [Gammaproteobacteria bacterium]